jgi:hypothetical protein
VLRVFLRHFGNYAEWNQWFNQRTREHRQISSVSISRVSRCHHFHFTPPYLSRSSHYRALDHRCLAFRSLLLSQFIPVSLDFAASSLSDHRIPRSRQPAPPFGISPPSRAFVAQALLPVGRTILENVCKNYINSCLPSSTKNPLRDDV